MRKEFQIYYILQYFCLSTCRKASLADHIDECFSTARIGHEDGNAHLLLKRQLHHLEDGIRSSLFANPEAAGEYSNDEAHLPRYRSYADSRDHPGSTIAATIKASPLAKDPLDDWATRAMDSVFGSPAMNPASLSQTVQSLATMRSEGSLNTRHLDCCNVLGIESPKPAASTRNMPATPPPIQYTQQVFHRTASPLVLTHVTRPSPSPARPLVNPIPSASAFGTTPAVDVARVSYSGLNLNGSTSSNPFDVRSSPHTQRKTTSAFGHNYSAVLPATTWHQYANQSVQSINGLRSDLASFYSTGNSGAGVAAKTGQPAAAAHRLSSPHVCSFLDFEYYIS